MPRISSPASRRLNPPSSSSAADEPSGVGEEAPAPREERPAGPSLRTSARPSADDWANGTEGDDFDGIRELPTPGLKRRVPRTRRVGGRATTRRCPACPSICANSCSAAPSSEADRMAICLLDRVAQRRRLPGRPAGGAGRATGGWRCRGRGAELDAAGCAVRSRCCSPLDPPVGVGARSWASACDLQLRALRACCRPPRAARAGRGAGAGLRRNTMDLLARRDVEAPDAGAAPAFDRGPSSRQAIALIGWPGAQARPALRRVDRTS